jgi:hypothetical protein
MRSKAGGPAFSFDLSRSALFDFRTVRALTVGLYRSVKIYFNRAANPSFTAILYTNAV